ncbi:hypothetical protein EON83_13645 [bacterium]|nr:MAG: hypothetical protein EON83_13645 [bacterium]
MVGVIAAIFVAAWFYQSRNEQLAPAKVKLVVGATLAVLCVVQGLLFQHFLQWMTYPDIAISIAALGTFVFPFVMWNPFGENVVALRKK